MKEKSARQRRRRGMGVLVELPDGAPMPQRCGGDEWEKGRCKGQGPPG